MYFLFDIGGTKMRLVLSEDGEKIGEPRIFPTPKNFDAGILIIEKYIRDFAPKKIRAVVGGIRRLDANKETLVNDFRLPGWSGKPVKKRLEEITDSPVYLENDAALAALGEAVFGAGRGHRIVSFITVSTGVGGARVVDQKIDENAMGFEPGHQVILMDEESGNVKNLESLIGGAFIEKETGKNPQDISDKEFWQRKIKFLAIGAANSIVHWSCDVLILGGPLIAGNKISIEKLRRNLGLILRIYPNLPDIKKAELGDSGGLYGALTYLKQIGQS